MYDHTPPPPAPLIWLFSHFLLTKTLKTACRCFNKPSVAEPALSVKKTKYIAGGHSDAFVSYVDRNFDEC